MSDRAQVMVFTKDPSLDISCSQRGARARRKQMKSKLLRGLGVTAALMIPLGGVSLIGIGTASATGTPAKVTAKLGSVGTLTCPVVTLAATGTATTISPCTTTGGLATFATVKGNIHGFNVTSVVTHKKLLKTKTRIKLSGTVNCTITFKKTITLTKTATHTKYTATVALKKTTSYKITPATGTGCGAVSLFINNKTATLTVLTNGTA